MKKYRMIFIMLLLLLTACNNSTELESTIESQNARIAELEVLLEEQGVLNSEQQAEIEILTYRPEWQRVVVQDLIENISDILVEAQLCQAHIMLPSEIPTISPFTESNIMFGRNGNVVVEVGGGHQTRLSHALLRWEVNEAFMLLPEPLIDWELVEYIRWEAIACFSIGGELGLAEIQGPISFITT